MEVFMKSLLKLFLVLSFVFTLTGCIGEEYDYTPPTVTLNDSSMTEELVEANIDWRGENGEPLSKETGDVFSFAREQTPFHINSGQKVDIRFDNEDFAVEKLNVSVWKNDEEIKLEVSDDRFFSFPEEKGEYVIVLDLRSDRGIAQYVGNVVIQ